MSEGENKNLIEQILQRRKLRKGLQIKKPVVRSGMEEPTIKNPLNSEESNINNVDGVRRNLNLPSETPEDPSDLTNPSEDNESDESEPGFNQDTNKTNSQSKEADPDKTLGKPEEKKLQQDQLGQQNTGSQEIPGGPAIEASKKGVDKSKVEPTLNQDGTKSKEGGKIGRAFSNGADSVKKGTDKAKQTAEKAKKIAEYAKKAVVAIKNLWAIISSWPILLIIAAVLALIIIVVLIAINLGKSNQSPNQYGKSAAQQVDPISDKSWIQKVLMLSGDTDVTKAMSEDFLNNLKVELTSTKDKLKDNPNALKKIDEILANIEKTKAATGTEKTNSAKAVKDGVVALASMLYDVTPLPSGIKTALPVDSKLIIATGFNKTLFIGTPSYPCGEGIRACAKLSDHTARTYMQSMAGAASDAKTEAKKELFKKPSNTCDAVKIGLANGTSVHPVFAGKVTQDSIETGLQIEKTDGSNKYVAVYALMSQKVKKGDAVDLNTEIGTVGSSQLHFELAVNGHCVVVAPAEASTVLSQNTDYVGYFLWKKILKVLHL